MLLVKLCHFSETICNWLLYIHSFVCDTWIDFLSFLKNAIYINYRYWMSQLHWKTRLPLTLESKDSGINFHGLLLLTHKHFTQTILNALSNYVKSMLFTSLANPFRVHNTLQIKVSLDISNIVPVFTLLYVDTVCLNCNSNIYNRITENSVML